MFINDWCWWSCQTCLLIQIDIYAIEYNYPVSSGANKLVKQKLYRWSTKLYMSSYRHGLHQHNVRKIYMMSVWSTAGTFWLVILTSSIRPRGRPRKQCQGKMSSKCPQGNNATLTFINISFSVYSLMGTLSNAVATSSRCFYNTIVTRVKHAIR